MGELDGQAAVVTGASGGIGQAICRILAAAGADVVVHYMGNHGGAEAAAKAVREAGRRAEIVRADVAVEADARGLARRAVESFGRLDILVNNAGTFPRSWALELTGQEWDTVLDTNLKGAFLCSQAAAAVMRETGHGRIVNVSSRSMFGALQGAHYAASKAGMVGLTRTLAMEWAPEILVNCVAPGMVDTPMPRRAMTDQSIAEAVGKIPLGRIGRPEDIAGAVLFLVSGGSSWITGQILHVNGGASMV